MQSDSGCRLNSGHQGREASHGNSRLQERLPATVRLRTSPRACSRRRSLRGKLMGAPLPRAKPATQVRPSCQLAPPGIALRSETGTHPAIGQMSHRPMECLSMKNLGSVGKNCTLECIHHQHTIDLIALQAQPFSRNSQCLSKLTRRSCAKSARMVGSPAPLCGAGNTC